MRFADFTDFEWTTGGASMRGYRAGEGPPLLLLHGHAQTAQLWESIAGRLAERHAIVVLDIDFEGTRATRAAASAPHESHASVPRHGASSQGARDIAADCAALMDALGFAQFMICGHDTGARVAQRLALDYGGRIDRIMVLDTAPALPADADRLVESDDRGDPERDERERTRANLERGQKIACPVRVLWAARADWPIVPIESWKQIARDTSGRALECEPCIPERAPDALLDEMSRFFDTRAC
ncbi:alpha/beta hydrolase [Pararobbsia silviterrae]|uniref:Alpha/beta hydrolase n=2 Tax=Pararobbsia silviterrae TaxID=1792498 RepID=A0A494YH73_9BURK|nr:alpha/beta hydrolase [Pararobbsia silviterrae]